MDENIKKYLPALGFCMCCLVIPQVAIAQALWADADSALPQVSAKTTILPASRFSHVRRVQADRVMLRMALAKSPLQSSGAQPVQIQLPMPNGGMMTFNIEESPVISADTAARIDYKSYRVSAVSNPAFSGRLDLGSHGFHGMVQTDEGMVFIDPASSAQDDQYNSYYKRDYIRDITRPFSCGIESKQTINSSPVTASKLSNQSSQLRVSTSNELFTYNIAVAATVEYSNAVGGGVPATTALEIASAINRVNVFFERDFAIQLFLVANDGTLVSTDAGDFSSNDPIAIISTFDVKNFIESKISSSSYDIGHVFTVGGGGVAGLGVVCLDSGVQHKTDGITGIASFLPGNISSAKADPFFIDFVAHEIGHQFGASHTFNGTTENCGAGNRNAATAYEPGSGTTIMAYAGICGAENTQVDPNLSDPAQGASDTTFHAGSIEQIVSFTRSGSGNSCATITTPGTPAPTAVSAGLDYTIPARTPFELVGTATGASLYQWDEMDVGAATNSITLGTDRITNPLFRSFSPSNNDSRTFPQLSKVLAGSFGDIEETLPDQNRELNFRFTAREGSGGVSDDDVKLTVDGFSGPFTVMQPNNLVTLNKNNSQVIEWNAACTDLAPVNCANVDILFSSDGGTSFSPVPGATGIPNVIGEATVSLASFADTNAARIKVACSGNIFFDVSDVNFSLAGTGQTLVSAGLGGSYNCNVPPVLVSFGLDNEPNDSPAQAQAITLPFSITGSVNDSVDRDDYFVFTASGGVTTITISNYSASDLDVALYNSSGIILIAESASEFGLTETINLGLASGQTYYIVVTGFDTSGLEQSYKLDVTIPPSGGGGDDGGALSRLLPGFMVMFLLLRLFSKRESVRRAL